MSVSGVSSSNSGVAIIPGFQNMQKIQQVFQQLGQDLQSGNLSAARSDSSSLGQQLPQCILASCSQSNSPIGQELSQLSQDLQAGNLYTARKDYSALQTDLQAVGIQPSGGSIQGLTNQLIGTAVHSWGLLSRAHVSNIMQQGTQQFQQNAGQYIVQNSSPAASNNLSVLA